MPTVSLIVDDIVVHQHILQYGQAAAGPDAKLDCHVDEGSGVITVCETFYDHDLSDIPAELLEALRKSGCCLSVLEDILMDDDVIYDK